MSDEDGRQEYKVSCEKAGQVDWGDRSRRCRKEMWEERPMRLDVGSARGTAGKESCHYTADRFQGGAPDQHGVRRETGLGKG